MDSTQGDTHFRDTDDDVFKRWMTYFLQGGAPALRGVTAQDYVECFRRLWKACETEEVFNLKVPIDTRVSTLWLQRLAPPPGSTDTFVAQPCADLCVVAVAQVRLDGSFVRAPRGYSPPPMRPGTHRAVTVVLPDLVPFDEPENPTPALYVLAIFDVLGFSNKLKELGLEEMNRRYDLLIKEALEPYAAGSQWAQLLVTGQDNVCWPGAFRLPIRYAYFSDTILLWIPYSPYIVRPFLDRLLSMFCEALRLGLPLRGAVSAGTAILHNRTTKFLGDPLVVAATLEKAQNWLGAAYGVCPEAETLSVEVRPYQLMLYDAPLKDKQEAPPLSGLVLDWPRRWREIYHASAKDVVLRLRTRGFETYYDAALAFIEHSDANPDWFAAWIQRNHERGNLHSPGQSSGSSNEASHESPSA